LFLNILCEPNKNILLCHVTLTIGCNVKIQKIIKVLVLSKYIHISR
jgi:hypothetical protein